MKKAGTIAALMLLVVAGAIALAERGRTESKSDALPPGKWVVSAQPYMGPMYESQPVKVIGVGSDVGAGYKVTKVGLKNTSSQAVSAVMLSWYVTSGQTGDAVLLRGESPTVTPRGGLTPGESEYFETPVVSFGRVIRPLLKEGALRGDFRIEVAVTGILYEDGSTWEGDPKNQVAAIKAGLRVGPVPQGGCPSQACYFLPEQRTYVCGAGPGQMCTNCGGSCANTICGEQVPSCPPKDSVGELEQ